MIVEFQTLAAGMIAVNARRIEGIGETRTPHTCALGMIGSDSPVKLNHPYLTAVSMWRKALEESRAD